MKTNKLRILGVIALLALVPFMEAGKIAPLGDQALPSHSSGFGGWNLGNVNVKMTDLDYVLNGKTFDETDGSYDPMVLGDTFESDIHDTIAANTGVVLVNLHGKNWPVGEPSGMKVIENGTFDNTMSRSRPAHCIMTTSYLDGTYLDAATPSETLCSSEFQTHKRFKLNMLPTMVGADNAYGTGVNLNFNVEANVDRWRYMILQKINNYTDKRISGFKIEIGFVDVGTGVFTPASTANGGGAADIKLSIGTGEDAGGDIWAADGLATFSHGLFGPQTFEVPDPHFPTDGFFDNTGAGFTVALNGAEDTIESTGAFVGSNYAALPVPNGAVASQFGDWLPSIWAPQGIFFDDDNDPNTDAKLMAFWGDTGAGAYAWMKGDRDNFAVATALELTAWASNNLYSIGTIEDVLNLGLNYIVEIGDTATFAAANAGGTFTIRITPYAALDQTVPGYIGNPPPAFSTYVEEEGTLAIVPTPTFVIGDSLLLAVADSGLNTLGNVDTVDINVTTSLGEYELITLTEILDRGVFTATLPTVSAKVAGADSDGSINVTGDTVVTANYEDANDGVTGTAVVTATTTATAATAPALLVISSGGGGSSFAVNDIMSLLFTIFGFLFIGGLIARRKLA